MVRIVVHYRYTVTYSFDLKSPACAAEFEQCLSAEEMLQPARLHAAIAASELLTLCIPGTFSFISVTGLPIWSKVYDAQPMSSNSIFEALHVLLLSRTPNVVLLHKMPLRISRTFSSSPLTTI